MTQAWPLHWPHGHPRTKTRIRSQFKTSLTGAINNVMDELRRFGADTGLKVESVTISSNFSLTEPRPADPGVAVYFRWDKIDACIAVDRYPLIEANLQAIAKVIEADRAKMRHGGLHIVRASFRGYAALPPPKDASGQLVAPWWKALGLPQDATVAQAEAAYRRAVKESHPDRGGDPAKFNMIVDAIRQAREQAQ
ncbi:MAG: hypothetical protein Dbin4_03116 [Alphaproteobacteria bacterium]|nr:hypothetical protein [Alphaproteobacteria bacterium]